MMDTIVMIRSVMVSDCIITYSLLFEYSENRIEMFRYEICGCFTVNFVRLLKISYFPLIFLAFWELVV